jgi:uncharacterized membrane protein YdjX (TVP38/TMEM64 family)
MTSQDSDTDIDLDAVRRDAGPAFWLAILWATVPALGGFVLLAKIGPFADWLDTHGDAALWIYAAFFGVTAGLGLLPTYAQAVLGGWVFGVRDGCLGSALGITIGVLLGYVITKLTSRDRVRAIVERYPKAAIVRAALLERGFLRTLGILSLLRVPPNMPFALANLAMTAAGARFVPYVLGAVIGMAPRTGVTVYLAAAAASTGAKDIQSFADSGEGKWMLLGGIAVLFIVLWVIGKIGQAALARALPSEITK